MPRKKYIKRQRKTIEQRFWSKVIIKGFFDCWEWQSALRGIGYGYLTINKKHISAHRLSYEMTYGKIPDNLYVLHNCDNPKCVNPYHLRLGTPQDNMDDKLKKKLTNNSFMKLRLTERQFKRTSAVINDLINNNTWKQISKN